VRRVARRAVGSDAEVVLRVVRQARDRVGRGVGGGCGHRGPGEVVGGTLHAEAGFVVAGVRPGELHTRVAHYLGGQARGDGGGGGAGVVGGVGVVPAGVVGADAIVVRRAGGEAGVVGEGGVVGAVGADLRPPVGAIGGALDLEAGFGGGVVGPGEVDGGAV